MEDGLDKLPFSIYDFFGYLAAGFIICAVIDYVLGLGWLVQEKITILQGTLWFIAAYIIGHINANISSWILEQNLIGKILKRPNIILFKDKDSLPQFHRYLFPGYYTSLPHDLIERLTTTARVNGIEVGGENFFHHARTIVKKSKETWERMNTFLQLYGFCRNVSFALLISAALFSTEWLLTEHRQSAIYSFICFIASIGMLYRYLKFYRQYSYEMFTSYPDIFTSTKEK